MHFSGFSLLEGDNLFISNLSNGIDLYSLRTLQRIRHYNYTAPINVPLQVTLAKQVLDWVVIGGVSSTLRVYDRATGELVHRLEHNSGGRVQVVNVSVPHISRLTFD